jgi:chemotaxis protein MotB
LVAGIIHTHTFNVTRKLIIMTADSELTPEVEHERIQPDSGGVGIEGDWPPDWMVTYSDMTTILMTFFVLLYALTAAKVDDDLLIIAQDEDDVMILGQEAQSSLSDVTEEEHQLIMQFKELSKDQQQTVLSEMRALRVKAKEVMAYLKQGKMEDEVEVKVTAEDIVIIPTAPLIFPEGSAEIRKSFYPILDKIAWLIKSTGASVRVEGHTDDTPIHPRHRSRYSSNWELSAARAISVAHYLEEDNIPSNRISASAYGSSHPRYSGEGPDIKSQNRRVEFHIYISSESISKD